MKYCQRDRYYRTGIYVFETDTVYKSRKTCAKELNISEQSICDVLSGRRESCKGYHLKLVDIDYEPSIMVDILNDLEYGNPRGCVWKEHPYYRDLLVSDSGRAMSCYHGEWRELTRSLNKRGYLTVHVHGKNRLLHILVAETFIPNPENKPLVNHDDGDKTNCNAWNLFWATYSENEYHAYRTGLKKAHHKGRPVRIIETGEVYPTITECASAVCGNEPGISRCLSNRRSTHRGYHYEYVDGGAR